VADKPKQLKTEKPVVIFSTYLISQKTKEDKKVELELPTEEKTPAPITVQNTPISTPVTPTSGSISKTPKTPLTTKIASPGIIL
jgi:hypothetical protein